MYDLGLDGINIDFQDPSTCLIVNNSSIKCSTGNIIMIIIDNLKPFLLGKLLTDSTSSTGAYGLNGYPLEKSNIGPGRDNCGMWINHLTMKSGTSLDKIYIMSFNEDSSFNPQDSFNAYRAIFKNKIAVGIEVPPEARGNNVLTVESAKNYANFISTQRDAGIFIWSLHKGNTTANSFTFLSPICDIFKLPNCTSPIPLN